MSLVLSIFVNVHMPILLLQHLINLLFNGHVRHTMQRKYCINRVAASWISQRKAFKEFGFLGKKTSVSSDLWLIF